MTNYKLRVLDLMSEKQSTNYFFNSDFSITVTPSEKEIEKTEDSPFPILNFGKSQSQEYNHLSPLSSFSMISAQRSISPDDINQNKYIKDLRGFRNRAQSSMLKSSTKRIDIRRYTLDKNYLNNRKQRSRCNCEII